LYEKGIKNPKTRQKAMMTYNLGSVRYLSGDLEQAILLYKKFLE